MGKFLLVKDVERRRQEGKGRSIYFFVILFFLKKRMEKNKTKHKALE